MTLTRIDATRMDFGWNPDERVAKIAAALQEQRANRRAATSDYDIDVSSRNVVDLEKTLARAEVNEAARQKHLATLEAERKAKTDEVDTRALAAITDQMRSNFLAQPGTTTADFDKALPRLLEQHREQAVLNAPAVREQQLAEAKQRLGRLF